jgi:hypothetical protein
MSQHDHQPIGDVVVDEVGLALPAPPSPSRQGGDGFLSAKEIRDRLLVFEHERQKRTDKLLEVERRHRVETER